MESNLTEGAVVVDAYNVLGYIALHRMGLEPIVLGNLPPAGDTIIEKLDEVKAQLFKELQAADYNPNPAGL